MSSTLEEGQTCPVWEDDYFCTGRMEYVTQGSCTCHCGHPPCAACVECILKCNACGVEYTGDGKELIE